MRELLVVLSLFAAVSARAVPGVCQGNDSCAYRCCRGNPGPGHPCICSLCCNATELGPDDRFSRVSDGKRAANVYRHRVEFFIGKSAKPRLTRSFQEGIYPVDGQTGKNGLIVCTSSEWALTASTAPERGFCGALRFDGTEIFRLTSDEAPGLSREPVGLAADGKEALLAVTKPRKSGDREIVGYRLWRKGRREELLPADGTRTRELLEKYQGVLVLTDPGRSE
ncbi:MAG: hypothetical protein M0D55_17515 [Elusimicrobiota bacterium]|nr:MAG: hypothetical protein M0D55_17515 [Elusimicrobiota bacterium]